MQSNHSSLQGILVMAEFNLPRDRESMSLKEAEDKELPNIYCRTVFN